MTNNNKKQHANATTTPEMRAFIRESDLPTAVLARLLKVSEATIRKWRKRQSTEDGSHQPKQLQTKLNQAQEYVVVELRKQLKLSLDELLAVCRQFIHSGVSRAGLQRCLKRHGVSKLADMDPVENYQQQEAPIKVAIEDIEQHDILVSEISPSAMREVLNRTNNLTQEQVVRVKVTELPDFIDDEEPSASKHKQRLLIANDPQSNWVYVDIYQGDEQQAAQRYMRYVLNKAPFHIRRILAGNYNEFLSRFRLLNEEADQALSHGTSENNPCKSTAVESTPTESHVRVKN